MHTELTNEELIAANEKINSELTELRLQVKQLTDKIIELNAIHSANYDELAVRKMSNAIDYELLLKAFPDSAVTYKLLGEVLCKFNLMNSGYWPQTAQRAIQVSFTKKDSEKNNNQIQGLLTLLPYITPIEDSSQLNGCKLFGILEHTLSEHASYIFGVRADNTVALLTQRYGTTTITELGEFQQAMNYIQQNHWYSKD